MEEMEEPEPREEKLVVEVFSAEKIPNRVLGECFGKEPISTKAEWMENTKIGQLGCWNYHCHFDLPSYVDEFLYVIDHFCKVFGGDAHIKADMLLDDIIDTIVCDHKFAKVENFALGYWTGRCGFIEKFASVKARDHSLSLTRIKANFHHHRRFLEIFFMEKCNGRKHCDVYKLKVAYGDIKKIVLKRELRHRDAFFEVNMKKEPVEVYLHVSAISCYRWHDPSLDAFEYCFEGNWDQTVQFGSPKGPTFCAIGTADVLKFKLDSTEAYPSEAVYALLRATAVPTFFANVRKYDLPKNAAVLTCNRASIHVRYALACIHGVAPELKFKLALDKNREEVQHLLNQLAQEDDSVLAAALYHIFYNVPDFKVIDLASAIKHSFAKEKAGGDMRSIIVSQDELPPNLVLMRKAIICPNKIFFEPPTAVKISSFLRTCDAENVMLVEIRNDDGKKLQVNSFNESTTHYLDSAIVAKLENGVKMGGKSYHFLGSTKRLREDFCFWAYGLDKKDSSGIEAVRRRLGIEGSLADKMRIQELVFAEALGCIEVSDNWISVEPSGELPDEENLKKGIGRMSVTVHRFIADSLRLDARAFSAVRIVHGGRGGILVLDPSLAGNRIVYRISQRVFASQDPKLYIIETSGPGPAVLDRVFLSTLSSKLHRFETNLPGTNYLAPLYEVLGDCVLPFWTSSRNLFRSLESNLAHIIRSTSTLSESLYDGHGDGLFRQAMRCAELKRLKQLKKLRVRLKSTYELMSVVDEVGVLNNEEVFIQLRGPGNTKSILNSDVVLAKRDAMQPAELRHFVAVDRPDVVDALGHLFDCVVFPSKGPVPPTAYLVEDADFVNESKVIVIADPELASLKNEEPTMVEMCCGVLVPDDIDLRDSFVNYIRYLGSKNFEEVFCALADSLPQRAYSEFCTRVSVTRRLLEEHRYEGPSIEPLPKIVNFPDFLEKISDRRTYCSFEPLGHIYRKVKFIDSDDFERTCINITELTLQTELEIRGSCRFEAAAELDLAIFKKKLAGLASLYRVSVDEVLTGTTLSISDEFISAERIEEIERTIRCHVKHLAQRCSRLFKRGMKGATDEENLQKVSAYYIVSRRFPDDGGYAFPWIVPDLMKDLIYAVHLKLPPAPDTKLRRKLLKFKGSTPDLRVTLMNNISGVLGNWFKVLKSIFPMAPSDVQYFSEKLTVFQNEAFEEAYRILEKQKRVELLHRDPAPLLAETLRQMLLSSSEEVDKDFSQTQFFMMALQTLLTNTLVQIAATSSLDVLTKPKKILKNRIVDRRLLLPIDETDDKYVRLTQCNISEYENRLCKYSGCSQVHVRVLAKEKTTNCEFEEITARGTWFSVLNLETIMLSPDYRKVTVSLFEVDLQRSLNNLILN